MPGGKDMGMDGQAGILPEDPITKVDRQKKYHPDLIHRDVPPWQNAIIMAALQEAPRIAMRS